MRKFESVIVVGSSGAGKTTLVNGLRTPEYQDSLIVPQRHITRPPREGDDFVENKHTSRERFLRRLDEGRIFPHWERMLDGGRTELYGFTAVPLVEERLRIYSANNAFFRDRNLSTEAVLSSGLVVVVTSAAESRTERLSERSPDMADAEREARLGDDGLDVLSGHTAVEVIDTSSLTPEEGQLAMQAIIKKLL